MKRIRLIEKNQYRYGVYARVVKKSFYRLRNWIGKKKSESKKLLLMDVNGLIKRCVLELQSLGRSRKQFIDIKHWPPWLRVFMLILIFTMTLGIVAVELWGSSRQELNALTNESLLLKSRYQRMAYEAALLEQRTERIDAMNNRFGQMLESIPAELEVVHVLDQVNNVARESGMTLVSFSPGNEIIEEAYATLPIDMELSGSFDAVGRFLEAVSRLKHLVTVDVLLESKDALSGKLYLIAKLKAYRGDLTKGMRKVEKGTGVPDAAR